MSIVSTVSVLPNASSSPLSQPKNKPGTSGASTVSWNFLGVYADDNSNVVVAMQAGSNRDGGKLDGAKDGGVFDAGTIGTYCYLTTDSKDANNWSVRVRTVKDGAGKGVTYTASSGGGHKASS